MTIHDIFAKDDESHDQQHTLGNSTQRGTQSSLVTV